MTANTLLSFVHLYHKQEITHKNTLKVNYASMNHGTGKVHSYILCNFTNMHLTHFLYNIVHLEILIF
jgi:hypothetical protein